MRRVMVRLDDDLYRALNDAAHDNRQSMNQYVIDAVRDRVQPNKLPKNRRC